MHTISLSLSRLTKASITQNTLMYGVAARLDFFLLLVKFCLPLFVATLSFPMFHHTFVIQFNLEILFLYAYLFYSLV